jgi:error-prone DNA polymerase
MGFYQPAQIVIDAQKHGVEVKPVDINHSSWDNTLEEMSGKYKILRLGFRQVKGLREVDMKALINAREKAYECINDLRKAGVPEAAIEKLSDADAFRSIGQDRREALWEISAKDQPVGLFSKIKAGLNKDERISLPLMNLSEHVVHDYAATSLSLKAHPVSFVREKLTQLHIVATADLRNYKDGDILKVSGLVLVKQRPGTASGVCFMTIEDETGVANLVVFQSVFDQFRKAVLQARLIMVEGKLQREGEVIHVIVSACYDLTRLLNTLSTGPRADENIFPEGRSFK